MENQLTLAINFIPSKETDEEQVIHSKSNSLAVMINNKAGEVIKGSNFINVINVIASA